MSEGPPRRGEPFLLDRRRLLLAAVGGVGALALTSCGGGKGGGSTGRPTVRLPLGALGFPTPFAANGGAGYNQMSLIYDTLLWKDSSGQLLPWLARSSTTSADHLTYGFELRDNAMWSDGRPVTPADVVFTFDYFAKQTLPPPVTIQGPEGVSKVVATGPRSVEITLEKPNVTFLEQVAASLPIVPEHVWSGISRAPDAQDVKVLIGSGAYRLESYKGDSEALSFVARDDYHLGRPYVGRIESTPIDDEFSGLLSGSTDVARGVGLRPDTLAPFKGNSRFGMVSQQGNSATCLYFNLTKGGPLADPKFRRACAMAIDGQDIVARLAAGNGRPGNPGFLGPENPFSSGIAPIKVDIAGAGQLLDGAGYRDTGSGTRQGPAGPLSFELLIGNNDVPVGEILVAALKRIGVELKLKAVEPGPQLFGTKLFAGYQMAVLFYPGPSAGGPNGDPDVLRQLFSSASPPSLTGATGYANPVFDDLAERQRITFDEAERKAIVGQMQKILAEDLPILALYYPETTLLFRTQVLDEWYFTPGQYPTTEYNKQLFITGRRTGTEIRPGR